MKNRVVIIHFQPLEIYPPVTNLVEVLTRNNDVLNLTIISTTNLMHLKNYQNDACKIIRFSGIHLMQSKAVRFFRYMSFYAGSVFNLILLRPTKILYYETLSSFPALVYYYLSFKRVKLLVHYHEYTSPAEYKKGMFLERWFHKLEQKIYTKVSWLSHTNEKRIGLFLHDHAGITVQNPQIMPNYPPGNWAQRSTPHHIIPTPIKIVYVGSVSTDTMYFPEFIDWVIAQQGNVLFDIYAFGYSPEFRSFVENRKSPYITLKGQLAYHQFPVVMQEYQVGVILYKGHIPNFVYNAPNKLFEYLACGLDVWFPNEMEGSRMYVTSDTYPKVTMVDFKHLAAFDMLKALSREGLQYKPTNYYCEPVYTKLIQFLTHD